MELLKITHSRNFPWLSVTYFYLHNLGLKPNVSYAILPHMNDSKIGSSCYTNIYSSLKHNLKNAYPGGKKRKGLTRIVIPSITIKTRTLTHPPHTPSHHHYQQQNKSSWLIQIVRNMVPIQYGMWWHLKGAIPPD